MLDRNTDFSGQHFESHSSAIQGPNKHVVFLVLSTQELRLHPRKHLTGIDFYKMQVKLTFFLCSPYLFSVDVNDERNL